jgi:CDP-diacylglycerol--serine O-phosphatidyltransferase
MRKIAVVPALLTLGNLLCGFAALVYLLDSRLSDGLPDMERITRAAWLVLFGMIFDAVDGLAARASRTTTSFGSQLDSMADLLTYGVVPAALVRMLAHPFYEQTDYLTREKVLWWMTALYCVSVALRLSRFNVEQRSSSREETFTGLPSPGAAGMIAATTLLTTGPLQDDPELQRTIFVLLPFAGLVLSFLMIFTIPYVHVTKRFLRGRQPFGRVVLLAFGIVLILKLPEVLLFLGFTGYVCSGPLGMLLRRGGAPAAAASDSETLVTEERL